MYIVHIIIITIIFLVNRHKAGKTVDGLYDVPRRDKLAVKTSVSKVKEDSSSDEDSGAIYAVPRRTSDELDDTINIEQRVNTPERNGILPNSVNETAAKDRSASPHMQNGHAEKQPPVTPRRVIVKSESDHNITPSVNRGEKLNQTTYLH